MGETALVSSLGPILAISGAAVAVILAGIGSCIGVAKAGTTGAGVLSEKPEAFGKILMLAILPGTKALYGIIVAFLVLYFFDVSSFTTNLGLQIFVACLPLAIMSVVSAIYQGKVASAGMGIIAKNPAGGGRAIILAVLMEIFALLGFLATFFMLNSIGIAINATA